MEIGLLLLRLLIAAIVFAHASQKLLGWFDGPGMQNSAKTFDELGHRPAMGMVVIAVIGELVGGTLLLVGFATPLGASIITGVMLVAGLSLVQVNKVFWAAKGGGEYALVLAVVSAAIALTGPGPVSVDSAVGARWYTLSPGASTAVGLVAIAVAIIAASVPVLRERAVLSSRAKTPEPQA